MKKILITGSSGFIGSYFINKYQKKYDFKTFSFLKDDFKTLYVKEIDVVFHLSALVHQMSGASAKDYKRVNVDQMIQLATKAKESGVKQFIFMSTIKVYGEENNIAYTESFPCNPIDEYGRSKLKAEIELQKLQDKNFKVSIIRTPIVYGYGVKANMKSLISLVNKVPFLPFAGICNKRSIVYVGNLCHLIDQVIEQQKSGIFLASDDEPLSTIRLIQLISKALYKKVYFVKLPFFEILLKISKPSIYKRLYKNLEVNNSETKEELNLQNLYTTEKGIKFMIDGEKE